MPFVQRIVEPVFLSRRNSAPEDENKSLTDYELETVANTTLSNALRQLASLVFIANDIFDSLTKELEDVRGRSNKLRKRIEVIEEKVSEFNPKTVTVPEGDLCSFAARAASRRFVACHAPSEGLFAAASRPAALRRLYEAAAPTPLPVMRQLDRYRRDGARCSRFFACTPVLGQRRRRRAPGARAAGDAGADADAHDGLSVLTADGVDLDLEDIETSMPACVSALRRWTSAEALGDVTVAPDASRLPAAAVASRAPPTAADAVAASDAVAAADAGDAETDHLLPSPEEQAAVVAARFPAQLVAVDVSGRAFRRMSLLRRSLVDAGGAASASAAGANASASARRRPRNRRRNTIAGTDQRELRRALAAGESQDETDDKALTLSAADDSVVGGSRSSSQKLKNSSSSEGKKSHFNSLKNWGKVKLKLIKGSSNDSTSKLSVEPSEEINIYETVAMKGKKADMKTERKASPSGSSLPISTQSGAMNMAVKLRQRQTRTGKDDALHSSSGNWSASSESGRASIGSETTHPPKSTTTLSSAATSSNSLNHHHPSSSGGSRRKFLNTSTSSSVSEGTLTPDIVSDFPVPFVDDGETSSIYSCDTEGYYTSFHLDSGLKTLKEEEITSTPQTPLHSTSALSNSPGRGNSTLTAENEYELFGKGSTSTTTSSAGTVCTTLLVSNNESNLSLARGPTVPERKSSLDQKEDCANSTSQMVVAMIHKQRGSEVSESPDSGHNTSSSPVDSTSSPQGTLTGRSSEYEFSESDLEGVDRIERIRVKTTINSSRIPSMCVITPPPSDDETCLNQYVPSSRRKTSVPSSNTRNRMSLLETDFGANIVHLQDKLPCPQNSEENTFVPSGDKTIHNDFKMTLDEEKKHVLTASAIRPLRFSPKLAQKVVDKREIEDESYQDKLESVKMPRLPPLNSVLGKMKEVLTSGGGQKDHAGAVPPNTSKANEDAGDYVTISKKIGQSSLDSTSENKVSKPPEINSSCNTEFISLNELPVSRTTSTANILISPSNSLERKRRQGARVTLDSEGKVIYSSDSLRRNKTSHTTFEPGPYVKDTLTSPTASPLMLHRAVKPNIRPVALSNQVGNYASNSSGSKPLSPLPETKLISSPTRIASPISPKLGKVIIRAGSRSNSQVTSPVSPGPVTSLNHPVSPLPSRGAYIKMRSPDEHQQRSLSPSKAALPSAPASHSLGEGKSTSIHLPQYVGPPPVRQDMKRLQQNVPMVDDQPNTYANFPSHQGHNGVQFRRFTNQTSHPTSTVTMREYNTNYGHRDFPFTSRNGAYCTSQNIRTANSCSEQPSVLQEEPILSQRTTRFPTPATIPMVPNYHNSHFSSKHVDERNYVHSSTPTKNDRRDCIMEISSVLSPILKEKDSSAGNLQNKRSLPQTKSSMTAEELFTAIHKSKKRLNIKADFDTYQRSGSPSSSSINSLSPGSSESSINGTKCSNDSLMQGFENTSRNRHSWSPNAKQSLDFQSINQPINYGHALSYKSSRVSDRLGPTQQTSRNDFKRLLLEHGSKNNSLGTYRRKLSAVEQLQLSRQQRHNLPPNSNNVYGAHLPPSPSDKRYNGPKLLPSPRSASTWRFASPRTDILSSTILEDCAEEEKALCSSEESQGQSTSLTMTAERSQKSQLSAEAALTNSVQSNKDTSQMTLNKLQTPNTNFSQFMYSGKKVLSGNSLRSQMLTDGRLSHSGTFYSGKSPSGAPLSPSNVKENVDANKQFSCINGQEKVNSSTLPESQLANMRARQLFMQHSNNCSNGEAIHSPPYLNQLPIDKQKQSCYSSRGSPGRTILAQIERKSPSRATLETAL